MSTWADRLAIIRTKAEEATASVFSDAIFLDDFNYAQRDIAKKLKFRLQKAVITTAANTAGYARPSYDLEPHSVVRGTIVLQREEPADYAGASVTATGDPYAYSVLGATVYLRPIPKATATVDYWSYRYPKPMVNATTTIDMPDDFLPIADQYCVAQAYKNIGDFDQYRACLDAYNGMLNDALVQQTFQNQADMPRTPTEVW